MKAESERDLAWAPRALPPAVAFPHQGWQGRTSPRLERVLLICYYDPSGVSTVPETVAFLQRTSRFRVTVLNLAEHRAVAGAYLQLHPWVNLDAYEAVVIHNTVAFNILNLQSLDRGLARTLRDYRGAKILMKQDENYRFRETAEYIGETGFDLVFTCLPPESVPLVYPPQVVGATRFEHMLTGYVTPTLRARWRKGAPRPIDIGYRGSTLPLTFGRLAYEKRRIGEDVERMLAGKGLVLDISSRDEERLGRDTWFDFLQSCKATLGVESGASIFDFEGDLEQRVARLEKDVEHLPTEHARAQAVLDALSGLEGRVHYNQISPRHLEAAACGTLQLLYPGGYSGILQPGRHYFPLARDGSNLDEAVELLRDDARREAITQCAYEEVVLDRRNWIEGFVERMDQRIDETLQAKGVQRRVALAAPAPAQNVLLLAAHDPVIDPRLGWVEQGAPGAMRVHQLGVMPPDAAGPRIAVLPRGSLLLARPRGNWDPELGLQLLAEVGHSPAGMAGAQELLFMQQALSLGEREFCALFGAPAQSPRNGQFRWYLRYILDCAATLIRDAREMRGVHALIATDLVTLPAALVLKAMFGVPLVYDAHEYWAEADVASFEYEKQFWVELERRMVVHAEYRQTVSPGLAALMGAQYGVPFETVPNCEPADRLRPQRAPAEREDGSCHFLFQGNFAPGRGIDLLIAAWGRTDPRAILQLRGPDCELKAAMVELARGTGLLGTRIVFPAAVDESRLVEAAAEADVGLIPYTPAGTNYRHCSPNKMSQYMAAGLPILANATTFVAATVADAGCGIVADFARQDAIVAAVQEFCESPQRRGAFAQAARDYFAQRFHWEVVSAPMYMALTDAVRARPAEPLQVFADIPQEPALEEVEPPPSAGGAAPTPRAAPAPRAAPTAAAAQVEAAPSATFVSAAGLWMRLPSPLRAALRPLARRIAARLRR